MKNHFIFFVWVLLIMFQQIAHSEEKSVSKQCEIKKQEYLTHCGPEISFSQEHQYTANFRLEGGTSLGTLFSVDFPVSSKITTTFRGGAQQFGGGFLRKRKIGGGISYGLENSVFSNSWMLTGMLFFSDEAIKTKKGSETSAHAISFFGSIGYQWLWNSGFNLMAQLGSLELINPISSEKHISHDETQENKDRIDLYLGTHFSTGASLLIGWFF